MVQCVQMEGGYLVHEPLGARCYSKYYLPIKFTPKTKNFSLVFIYYYNQILRVYNIVSKF